MNVQPDLHMDKAAFLAWVEGREGRYELAGGRVLMMTGGTMGHGLVIGNLFEMLRARLDRKRWAVVPEFGVDVGPRTIRYPDVVVVDRPGASRKDLTAKAPALVAEVLSPSTMTIDLGDKAAEYLRLPSLLAYLVLAQDEVKAWVYVRLVCFLLRRWLPERTPPSAFRRLASSFRSQTFTPALISTDRLRLM
jgi:Uma2 family endonuclease